MVRAHQPYVLRPAASRITGNPGFDLLLSQAKGRRVLDDRDFNVGALSGLLAIILVIALAILAMTSLNAPPVTQATKIEPSAETNAR